MRHPDLIDKPGFASQINQGKGIQADEIDSRSTTHMRQGGLAAFRTTERENCGEHGQTSKSRNKNAHVQKYTQKTRSTTLLLEEEA